MIQLLVSLVAGPPQVLQMVIAPAETLHVEIQGSGPTVVMIPGLFGSAYGYRHVVSRLVASGRRAIVIEPLGLASSSRPQADYSLTAQAERIAAVLDSLKVTDAVIVSHAVGTGMALRLALVRPALVNAVVSLGGGVTESAGTPGLKKAVSFGPLIRLLGSGQMQKRVRSSLIAASGNSTWVTDSVVAAYAGRATEDLGATLAVFKGMVTSHERIPLGSRLGELTCPVTLLLGGSPHDGRTDEREILQLRREVVRFELTMVAGAGSYLHEEQPGAVIEAVERAIAGHTRVATGNIGGRQ